jgi:hypothetical protein
VLLAVVEVENRDATDTVRKLVSCVAHPCEIGCLGSFEQLPGGGRDFGNTLALILATDTVTASWSSPSTALPLEPNIAAD